MVKLYCRTLILRCFCCFFSATKRRPWNRAGNIFFGVTRDFWEMTFSRSPLLRENFLFLMLFFAIIHRAYSLRGQKKCFQEEKKQLATARKCLPMMTINILMRNANELTSTWYKSCGRTATSLQLRPEKKATKKIKPLSVGSLFAIFISRFSAFCQAEKIHNDDAQRKMIYFVLWIRRLQCKGKRAP